MNYFASCKLTLILYFIFQLASKAETEDNEQEQKRQQGKKLLYGQIIQVNISNIIVASQCGD